MQFEFKRADIEHLGELLAQASELLWEYRRTAPRQVLRYVDLQVRIEESLQKYQMAHLRTTVRPPLGIGHA